MRLIETDSLSNQSLATALLAGSYTADDDRMVFVRLFADQVAGNGDYVAYITVQRAGAGSFYEYQPRTTATVASGVTAIAFQTIPLMLKSTDVMRVYLVGLAGDTTTPDLIVEWWEDDSLRPTTAGQHFVDVDADGGVEVDSLQAGAITETAIAAGAFTATKFANGAFDAVWTVTTRTLTSFGTLIADIWAYLMTSVVSNDGSIGGFIKYHLGTPVHQAKLEVVDDNALLADRYVISWFENGEPLSAGVSGAFIQVIKVADGTDLVPVTAMSQVGATSNYRYYATGAERMESGVAYIAIATATIGGLTQEWRQPVGIDS